MVVVVVDDEREVLELIADVLEEEGYEVHAVGVPEHLLSPTETPDPDLFIIDLMMPGIDGITLARRLREGSYPDTPMIALSASNAMLVAARESALFTLTLAKPFDLAMLLATVKRAVEGTR